MADRHPFTQATKAELLRLLNAIVDLAYWGRSAGNPYVARDHMHEVYRHARTAVRAVEAIEVADATAAVEQIGHHEVYLATGYCHTCGVHHNPTEIERARERAAGEEGS